MSQGGEVTTQQVVYGPDGKAYGNPALARAAGVNQTYREDGTAYPTSNVGIQNATLPPDFIPLPGPDFSPMPNPPSGGADPYSQIMGQMGYGSDPYSQIMSQMPVRQNPYARASSGLLGGYDPSIYNNAFVGSNSRLNLSGLLGGGGAGGGGGVDAVPSDWDNMTNSQRAAYYAENPNMASVTRGLQSVFGNTLYGKIQNYFNPGFVSEQRALTSLDPAAYQAAKESFRALEIAAMNAGYPSTIAQNAQAMQSMQDALAADTAAAQAQSISDQSSAGSEAGGYGTGDTSGGFGEGQYNMGGLVDRVSGPNPPGPDDGAGMLQLGEYVIKKSAVNKYGTGLLDMINNGKIPAKKMKSLLG